VSVRIVIEFDAADGRATVTTEPPQPGETAAATATLEAAAAAIDAGPPAGGAPLPGQAAAAAGRAVDAGPAPEAVGPEAVGPGTVAGSESVDGGSAHGEQA
jgi:hypothetical protein